MTDSTPAEKRKYFIGIPVMRFADEAEINRVRSDIAEQFNLPDPIARIPAHCTLVSPFMANKWQVVAIRQAMAGLANLGSPFQERFTDVSAFGAHSHVLRLQNESLRLRMIKFALRGAVQDAGCELLPDLGHDFHVSLAVDIPDAQTHAAIGAFLREEAQRFRLRNLEQFIVCVIVLYEQVQRQTKRWEVASVSSLLRPVELEKVTRKSAGEFV